MEEDFVAQELRCWCGAAVLSSGQHMLGRLIIVCAENARHNWRVDGAYKERT